VEQSPSWKANRFAATQQIPHILWNPTVHYRIQKRPPPVPILGHLDQVHTPTSNLLNIHLNIILPGDRGSTVVKVLCYKSEGRWSDPRWCQWIFHWHKYFRSHYGPGVDSAPNINDYKEYFLGVMAGGA